LRARSAPPASAPSTSYGTGTSQAFWYQATRATCLARRKSASCAATGGFTEEIVHDDSIPSMPSCDHAADHAGGSRARATRSARVPSSSTRAHLRREFPRSATKRTTAQAPVAETAAARIGTDSGSVSGFCSRWARNMTTIWWMSCGMPCPVTAEIASTSRLS
jgi:hypothetical protein